MPAEFHKRVRARLRKARVKDVLPEDRACFTENLETFGSLVCYANGKEWHEHRQPKSRPDSAADAD